MLGVDNVEKLELVCELVFETAIKQPLYSVIYANLCRVLTDAVSIFQIFVNIIEF